MPLQTDLHIAHYEIPNSVEKHHKRLFLFWYFPYFFGSYIDYTLYTTWQAQVDTHIWLRSGFLMCLSLPMMSEYTYLITTKYIIGFVPIDCYNARLIAQ